MEAVIDLLAAGSQPGFKLLDQRLNLYRRSLRIHHESFEVRKFRFKKGKADLGEGSRAGFSMVEELERIA